MADVTNTDVSIHLLRDAENGLAKFVAEVEGALIPLATVKLGTLEAWLESQIDGDKVPAPASPAASTTTATTTS
jgi:hypothetical protein